MWSGFRVAKRAKIIERQILNADGNVKLFAVHDGFSKQGVKCLYKRNLLVNYSIIEVTDELIGHFQTVAGYLHLHPDVQISKLSESMLTLEVGDFNVNL